MEESDAAVSAESLATAGAFAVIFDRHGSTLLRFLARRVDPAEAEDILGEVFLVAFERRSTFERIGTRPGPGCTVSSPNVVAVIIFGGATSRVTAIRAPLAQADRDSPATTPRHVFAGCHRPLAALRPHQ